MIITAISWFVIGIYVWISGEIVAAFIEKLFSYRIVKTQNMLLGGIIFLTLYAETFSVFCKLGKVSVLVLSVLGVLSLFFLRPQIIHRIKMVKAMIAGWKPHFPGLLLLSASILALGAYSASKYSGGFDTWNYHIPSIRWIEEYGIVKGLGNLHTRFAYNSSFLCLQALFSFKWFYGSSMHSMNGFLWIFMVFSCISSFSIFKEKRLMLSDLVGLLFLCLLFRKDELYVLMSPNTDFMPMCLTLYLFIQWLSLCEKEEANYVPYGLLSIAGLFSASAKLSAGVLFVFAAAPIVKILKKKQYGDLLKFSVLGFLVLIPFVIRNIILSGYVLYPVAGIDLFNFDWEIPKAVIVSDHAAIISCARFGLDWTYVDLSKSFGHWYPDWLAMYSELYRVLSVVDITISILSIAYILYLLFWKKNRNIYEVMPLSTATIGYLFLLFSAYCVRFGRLWFYLLPLLFIYEIARAFIEGHNCSIAFKTKRLFSGSLILCSILVLGNLICYMIQDKKTDSISSQIIFRPIEYGTDGNRGDTYELGGIVFYYYSSDSNGTGYLNGYYGFPGTECLETLEKIELRGGGLEDGFSVKDSFKSIPYDFQGKILDNDSMLALGLEKYYELSD